jgi:serine protease Do
MMYNFYSNNSEDFIMLTHTLLRYSLFIILFLQSAVTKVGAADDEQKVLSDIKSTVVKIETTIKNTKTDTFFQVNGAVIKGTTTGVVIDSDGKILTNNNVEGTVTVIFNDGRRLPAQIIKKDDEIQLSLLKVDLNNLKSLTIAKEIPPVGGKVIVAGFEGVQPNEQSFVTVPGKVTSDKYEIQASKPLYGYFITTDVAIKPSMNVLFNEKGELLGVVGLHNIKTGIPPSIFYPIQNIPSEKLEAFIK